MMQFLLRRATRIIPREIYRPIQSRMSKTSSIIPFHYYYPNTTQDSTKLVDILLERINEFGEILVYEQESHFREVFLGKELPKGITLVTPRKRQTTASDGSTIEVKLHQDMSILENAPQYTFLMGVQEHPKKKVYTSIVSNRVLYDLLPDDVKQGLQKSIFLQNKPTSYSEDTFFESFPRPLLVMDEEKGPIFKLRPTDSGEIEPLDEEAKYCYGELIKHRDYAAEHLAEKILLLKGDILIIDNHRTVHTRDVFDAYFDGTDRMIFRVYVSQHKL